MLLGDLVHLRSFPQCVFILVALLSSALIPLPRAISAPPVAPGHQDTNSELVTLEKGDFSPYGQSLLIVNSAGEWREAMKKLERDGILFVVPGPDAPEGVDWSRECVAMFSPAASGYDVELTLIKGKNGRAMLYPVYSPLNWSEALPYHLVRMNKHTWLPTQLWEGLDATTALPMFGKDAPLPDPADTWGFVKAAYR